MRGRINLIVFTNVRGEERLGVLLEKFLSFCALLMLMVKMAVGQIPFTFYITLSSLSLYQADQFCYNSIIRGTAVKNVSIKVTQTLTLAIHDPFSRFPLCCCCCF